MIEILLKVPLNTIKQTKHIEKAKYQSVSVRKVQARKLFAGFMRPFLLTNTTEKNIVEWSAFTIKKTH